MDRLTLLVGRPNESVAPTKYFFKVSQVGRFIPLVLWNPHLTQISEISARGRDLGVDNSSYQGIWDFRQGEGGRTGKINVIRFTKTLRIGMHARDINILLQ